MLGGGSCVIEGRPHGACGRAGGSEKSGERAREGRGMDLKAQGGQRIGVERSPGRRQEEGEGQRGSEELVVIKSCL